ncbi:MAG: myo-inosose-2 dehydratase [Paracoccaceae bacterium]
MLEAKLGISPICWWNDDLVELSDDVSLDECLRQVALAGYTGCETGRRFPMSYAELGPILRKHGVGVCGGWFSGTILDGDIAANKERIRAQMDLFIAAGAPCIVYGEVAGSIQGQQRMPLDRKPRLSVGEMRTYARNMTAFGEWCADQGMPLSYHHHMGAVIQDEDEIDAFMANSGEGIPLLFDAGHLAFAGGDVVRVIDRHHARITHVHTKDVRMDVIRALDWSRDSFLDAVIRGAFTVPGDGSLDFGAIVKRLADHGYEGWFVVEAEQDPKRAPPLEWSTNGNRELKRIMAGAGYSVVG